MGTKKRFGSDSEAQFSHCFKNSFSGGTQLIFCNWNLVNVGIH